jgi:hypothetical protein
MQIALIVDPANARRWHERLRDRLTGLLPDAKIQLFAAEGAEGYSTSVELLLTLERMLLRHGRPTLSDKSAIKLPTYSPDTLANGDWIIDLRGVSAPLIHRDATVLRPLYDGLPAEDQAIAMILGGAIPSIAIENTANHHSVAGGRPSFEAADGLTGGLEALFSRVITLIEQKLLSPHRPDLGAVEIEPHRTGRGPAAFFLRNMARECVRRIYRLCCHSPHWRIGWRVIDGPGVVETGSLSGPQWQTLPDASVAFSADPFPFEWQGQTCLFFERLDYRSGKGLIYAQKFDAKGPVGEAELVIEEPWHLSYPFLIERKGELYMVPEASLSGALYIYRCVEFPGKWQREGQLLNGIEAADATIFEHAGRFWMTSVTRDGIGGYSDTLAIHHAQDLLGPWEEHAQRPVLMDSRFARPAGAVVAVDGALVRPVQDCSTGYGKALALMRIDQLDAENFAQTRTALIEPGPKWPGTRLHTINRAGRLECIDGVVITPKSAALARRLHDTLDRRAAAAS